MATVSESVIESVSESVVESVSIETESASATEISLDQILGALKSLKPTELVTVMNSALSLMGKKAKAMEKTEKKDEKPKDPNRGKQLKKPRAWVNYVHKYATENGWEPFLVKNAKEEIEMPGSVEHNGIHVFANSITEKLPEGKKLILKDAMSLSRSYKTDKPELYAEFEAQYKEEESVEAPKAPKEKSAAPVRKTLAEKQAESEAKKATKAPKTPKEPKEPKAPKEKKTSPKSSPKTEAKVPKAAVAAKEIPVATKAAEPATSMDTPKLKGKKAPAASVDEWVAPPAGKCAPFTFKGKKYIRSSDDEMWTQGADGGAGEWVGMFDPKTGKIDTSVTDPYADDEEDNE